MKTPRYLREAKYERAESPSWINGVALLPLAMMVAGFLLMVAVYWDQIRWGK